MEQIGQGRSRFSHRVSQPTPHQKLEKWKIEIKKGKKKKIWGDVKCGGAEDVRKYFNKNYICTENYLMGVGKKKEKKKIVFWHFYLFTNNYFNMGKKRGNESLKKEKIYIKLAHKQRKEKKANQKKKKK